MSDQQNFILKRISEVDEGLGKCALLYSGGGQAKLPNHFAGHGGIRKSLQISMPCDPEILPLGNEDIIRDVRGLLQEASEDTQSILGPGLGTGNSAGRKQT